METYENYKGYGIRYKQIGGVTSIEYNGYTLASFIGVGSIRGNEIAKKHINRLSQEIEHDCNRETM